MEELGHNGSDDDDGGFAFLLEALGEGFADGVETHVRHGRKEQRFADVAVARLAHRGARFATSAALEDARCHLQLCHTIMPGIQLACRCFFEVVGCCYGCDERR